MASRKSKSDTKVVHVGVVADTPGGMAQVVNRYLEWHYEGFDVTAIASTRGKRDARALLLWPMAVARLLLWRRNGSRRVAVFHLSEGGSFLREGSLMLWARAMRCGTVAHLHGANFESFAARHGWLVRRVLKWADVIAVLSHGSSLQVKALLGDDAPIHMVANGVSVREVPPLSARQKQVVMGGEMGHRKGLDLILKSWRNMGPLYKDWTLVLAGPWVVSKDALIGVEGVLVLGTVSHEDLRERLRCSRVAVLPSRHEALPMFLIEAVAEGCAVVASDVGQVSSIVSSNNGRLFSLATNDALSAALRDLMTADDSTLDAMGSYSHNLAKANFSEEVVRSQLCTVWLAALDKSDRS